MNQYYEEILALPEKGTMDVVLAKWEQIHKRMKEGYVKARHLLPELYLLGAPGIGKSHLLSLLAGYLEEARLMVFLGERKYVEFRLEYCPEHENFTELNRFINKLSEMAGFRNDFRGIVCIELDEWLEHFKEKYFNVFIEYLEENCDNWLIVFSVNSSVENEEELFSYLSMYFRMDKVKLSIPSAEEYMGHLGEVLATYGFSLSPSAKSILVGSIEELKKSPLFDGYKSINRLGMDVAYEKYISEDFRKRQIAEQDVAMFAPESEYIQTMIKNYEKKKQVGFM